MGPIIGSVIEFFVECLEMLIGGTRRRHQHSASRRVYSGFGIIAAAFFLALAAIIFFFWATIVSVALIAFWIAVAIGLVVGVVKFFAD